MAMFKLFNHTGQFIALRDIKVRTMDGAENATFTQAMKNGIRHENVLYHWKEYDEQFQSDPPQQIQIDVSFNMKEIETQLNQIPGVHRVIRFMDSFLLECDRADQGRVLKAAVMVHRRVEANVR